MQADILHPLTSLKWRAMCRRVPVSTRVTHALYLNGNVYASEKAAAQLYIYDLPSDSWNAIDTPSYGYALTHYRSRILLIGGREPGEEKPTNKLWLMSKDYKWESTLPPMEVACVHALAVSHGDHILVFDNDRYEIYVFTGRAWATAEPPSVKLQGIKSSIIGNEWYLTGESFDSFVEQQRVIHASLEALVATCRRSLLETPQSISVWKVLAHFPSGCCSLAEFGGRLIAVGSSAIYAYSSHAELWVHIGDVPVPYPMPHSILLPSNKLMVIMKKTNFMVKLKGKQCHAYMTLCGMPA